MNAAFHGAAGAPEQGHFYVLPIRGTPWANTAQPLHPPHHAGHPQMGTPPRVGRGNRVCAAGAGFGPLCLTRYLFSPICSTWNLLAHLHWATCRVTCQQQRQVRDQDFACFHPKSLDNTQPYTALQNHSRYWWHQSIILAQHHHNPIFSPPFCLPRCRPTA